MYEARCPYPRFAKKAPLPQAGFSLFPLDETIFGHPRGRLETNAAVA
jgi:hypothetical protein